ncbi:unnamed protein product [Cylicocyclus nassatus]|uniref:LIM zinc-binding domain-containing protein n=1 Tax=Cylicocyclus nassatus TaxID=53992 RepID=A0AA36GUX7_CYLNA|nr:unnamed protein product [Cylicocyclus nassatus]
MSAKKCAREECGKTVYPLEELKCLDKVWHKQCFKCTVCGMTLNMKNYKGYDKMPYCEPHYPKTVASVVTDTPEMRRVAENTKNQSQPAAAMTKAAVQRDWHKILVHNALMKV